MATDVKMVSVFAEPRKIIDKDEAVELLTAVLPDLNARELRDKLSTKRGFVWSSAKSRRASSWRCIASAFPAWVFLPENKRVYPNGNVAAHVLGFANVDNQGHLRHREIY